MFLSCLRDEVPNHIIRVVGVADGICRTKQHLQQQIGHGLAKIREPSPRILFQKPHCDIESGAAPALNRK
jgi:hypothetical protein